MFIRIEARLLPHSVVKVHQNGETVPYIPDFECQSSSEAALTARLSLEQQTQMLPEKSLFAFVGEQLDGFFWWEPAHPDKTSVRRSLRAIVGGRVCQEEVNRFLFHVAVAFGRFAQNSAEVFNQLHIVQARLFVNLA